MKAIRYNDLSTWPSDALDLLESRQRELIAYTKRKNEIDAMRSSCERRGQTNEFTDVRNDVCGRITEILTVHQIIGIHFTRLTPDEVAAITSKGIQVSSVERANERICRRVAAGDLTSEEGEKLRKAHVYDKLTRGQRLGMFWIWVSCGTPSESSIYRLLRYWGGEAMYIDHEEQPMGDVLRQIGEPCIVEIAVSPEHLHQTDIGEQFVKGWIRHQQSENDDGFDTYVTSDLGPCHVLRVIKPCDSDFNHLTGADRWDEPLR